jgi:CubicO group peptidase (beta-lactamase class C family)
MRIPVLMVCVTIVGTSPSLARAPRPIPAPAPDSAALGRSLDEYFTRAEAFGFSGAVVVARGGRQILRKGYGYADRRAGVLNTPETVFGLSSGDKQIIAAAIMRLTELGRLRVSDTLGTFFPTAPHDKTAITLRQVMSHTSGIPNEYWDDHKDLPRDQFIEDVLSKPLRFAPGTGWAYSNANFWLLEEVITRVARMPYEQFIEEHLFRPAGMTSTGFPSRGWDGRTIATYRPWTFEIPKGQMVDAEPLMDRQRWNWQLMTTVDDLFKWYLALRGNKVLTAQSKDEMFTPVRANYGYGWNVVRTRRGTRLVHHGGAGDGVGMTATIRLWIDEDVAVIILANSTTPAITADGIGPALESVIFGGDAQLPPAAYPVPASHALAIGTYRLPNGGSFAIRQVTGGRLVAQSTDPKAILYLVLPDAVAPLDSGEHNQESEDALSAAFRNDWEPLRRLVRPFENFESRRAQMAGLVDRFKRLGTFETGRTVYQRGYDFSGRPEIQSFLHVHFSAGDALVRVLQLSTGATNFDARPLPPLVEMPLAANAAGVPTAWNFQWGNATQMIARVENGSTMIELRGSRGSIIGVKQQMNGS